MQLPVEVVNPVPCPYWPGSHLAHPVMPVSCAHVPSGHEVQMLGVVAPTLLLYFPAGHKKHADKPVRLENDPTAHTVQLFWPGKLKFPNPQITGAGDAGGQKYPAGHTVMVTAPTDKTHRPMGNVVMVAAPVIELLV